MPEILTKYPDIVLTILKDANIACGTGAKQKILTQCPENQFCSLPTGELCVYGTKQMSAMSQIHPFDLLSISGFFVTFIGALIVTFLGGLLLGVHLKK